MAMSGSSKRMIQQFAYTQLSAPFKNSYNEDKCQAQIDALYECCNAFYQQQGDQASTVSCPKAGLLRLKMKQRAQAAQDNN
ncbi:Cx9C motif-containing protein 4 [Penicillium oxalicum]|uniref:Cx9C motif-containing protein 4 n=1 Tax=Penicillium oxalicum TaxID=69781 RepID=UPI0020B6D860|nr:Cx9C motif-containing protein 4 [Penicillium oxalicum]KAI2791247.1 Cx9C motif-containing protein 4 [Penicillium oxalicum]